MFQDSRFFRFNAVQDHVHDSMVWPMQTVVWLVLGFLGGTEVVKLIKNSIFSLSFHHFDQPLGANPAELNQPGTRNDGRWSCSRDQVSYNAAISACSKGTQWHRALHLLDAMMVSQLVH